MQPSFNLSSSTTFTEVLPGVFNSEPGEQKRKTSSSDISSAFRSTQLLHEKVLISIYF